MALEGWANENDFQGLTAVAAKYIGRMKSNTSYPLRSIAENTWPQQWLRGSSLIIPTLTPGDDSATRFFFTTCAGALPYQLKREGWWNIYNRLISSDKGTSAAYAGYIYAPSAQDETMLEAWKTDYNNFITPLNFESGDQVPSLNSNFPSPFQDQDQDYNESWNWVAYISALGGQGSSSALYMAYWCGSTTHFAIDLNNQTFSGCTGV